jgi:hypothetical protein
LAIAALRDAASTGNTTTQAKSAAPARRASSTPRTHALVRPTSAGSHRARPFTCIRSRKPSRSVRLAPRHPPTSAGACHAGQAPTRTAHRADAPRAARAPFRPSTAAPSVAYARLDSAISSSSLTKASRFSCARARPAIAALLRPSTAPTCVPHAAPGSLRQTLPLWPARPVLWIRSRQRLACSSAT